MIDAADPYRDLAAFAAVPRLTGLVLSPNGSRLVASMQQPDEKGSSYVGSLWEIALDGGPPARLTHSAKGEFAPAFLPDGSLLFVAKPAGVDSDSDGNDEDEEDDEPALWQLPDAGEARIVARHPGGFGAPIVAAGSGAVIVSASRLMYSAPDNDAVRRRVRKQRKISAILHTGMPIRHWDHELGDESPRLLHLDGPGAEARDLAADAVTELVETDYSVSADGAVVASQWRSRQRHGAELHAVAVIDVPSRRRTIIAPEAGCQFATPRISPDGRRVAMQRQREGTFETPVYCTVVVGSTSAGEQVDADLGDLYPSTWAWSADSGTLWVAGDWHGRGAVVAVDPATGAVTKRLASDAVYTSLCPSPEGRYLYALRSTIAEPPEPVRLDVEAQDQAPVRLPSPAGVPRPPGRLTEVAVEVDGAAVRGWLCLPPESDTPAPLMQWIHGGPFMSYNSWSWRWVPWLAVARGWAVLMPDPALSTGYGERYIERAWPYQARLVWRDIEALLDTVVARPDIDETRTACLGASFGGFMNNWIAGHTGRFRAMVTHAGLWALDQQHATTDAARYKTAVFGTLAEHPDWYAENSPHNSVEDIRTPMLIVHGNRDYRVPVSEALRLWWDLISRYDGDPESMPHRFLQLTGENHWVLSPANAEIWWDVVLGFCAEHVLDQAWTPTALL